MFYKYRFDRLTEEYNSTTNKENAYLMKMQQKPIKTPKVFYVNNPVPV